jgi:hypothetical protein
MKRGKYVPLAEQDPALWDSQIIDEAEALLLRTGALGLSAAIKSKARCSLRSFIAVAQVTPTGERRRSYTTRRWRVAAGLLVDKIIGYLAMGREPYIRFAQHILNHLLECSQPHASARALGMLAGRIDSAGYILIHVVEMT